MAKKPTKLEEKYFTFPDFPEILYPCRLEAESGNMFNLKTTLYPNPRSIKKYTRKKQLSKRSLQAKIFDAIINIGYFDPLEVWIEFPVVIKNSLRLPGQGGSYYLLDYYFPDLRLAVELDSDLHNPKKDQIRDQFLLETYGIATIRITDLQKPSVQKKEFKELTKLMRLRGTMPRVNFNFAQ